MRKRHFLTETFWRAKDLSLVLNVQSSGMARCVSHEQAKAAANSYFARPLIYFLHGSQ